MGEATHLQLCAGYNWILTAMAGPHKGKRQRAEACCRFASKSEKMHLHLAGTFVIMAIIACLSDMNEQTIIERTDPHECIT